MALIKCSECKKEVSNKAKACPHCGNPINVEKKKKICKECQCKNDIDSTFCEECGSSFVEKKESLKWDFSSKFLTLSVWLCIIMAFLLGRDSEVWEAIERYLSISFRSVDFSLGLTILGVFILFFTNKEKISLNNEITKLKKLELSKNQVSIFLILAGVLIFVFPSKGSIGQPFDNIVPYLISVMAFLSVIITIIVYNWQQLKSIREFISLTISIICFIATGLLYVHGDRLNNDTMSKVESFFETGNANPGDVYIDYAVITLVVAVVFLILFFASRTKKEKK